MTPQDHLKFIETLGHHLLAGAVATARIGGLVSLFPGFTRLGLSGILRGSVAMTLAVPLIPVIEESWFQANHSAIETMILLFKEFIVGLTIAAVLAVPFWAAELGGGALDIQRASSLGNLVDPVNVEQANVTSTLFVLMMLALFYVSGGMVLMLKTFYGSYVLWPPGQFLPFFNANTGEFCLNLLDDIFSMGLMLVIPLMFILLLADICLALVARASPNMHVFDLSLSVKNFLLILFLVPYLGFLIEYMKQDISTLTTADARLQSISGSLEPK